ncbi:MAG: alanine racemase [Deltaproteobacteria bacterium GWA2_54_12]|nr:MAG: alanine racemase [Deltaproteobacteria bacterium GWA2_54_12]
MLELEVLHKRPTAAYIDLKALEHNYLELRRRVTPAARMMAVVKANAYGHGAIEAARTLESLGGAYFGVAIQEEGAALREAGITSPIAVLGGSFPDQAPDMVEYGLTPVVFDMDSARALDEAAKKRGAVLPIHVKIDTGMGRLGILPEEAGSFFSELKGLENLKVEALLSHFAESEAEEKEFSHRQLSVFLKAVEDIRALGVNPALLEMANSAALVDFEQSRLGMVRPGIMLYGSYPAARMRESIKLKPVMQLKTRILFLKSVPAGFTVSYGRRFTAKRTSLIATLPIGYADGLPRTLGNSGEVLVGGKRAPIAGTVCMDLIMVDVTDVPGVKAGDEAVIIGAQGAEVITAEEVADKAGTISYEIFCRISARVPRIYIR